MFHMFDICSLFTTEGSAARQTLNNTEYQDGVGCYSKTKFSAYVTIVDYSKASCLTRVYSLHYHIELVQIHTYIAAHLFFFGIKTQARDKISIRTEHRSF